MFVIATVDEWTALSATAHGCNVSLLKAYDDHCRHNRACDPEWMRTLIENGDVSYVEIQMGEALRDGSRVLVPL